MKAVHSLWTQTQKFELTRAEAIVFSAAAAYTRRAFAKTELVTDCMGLRIAERLGWSFGSYSTALEGLCAPGDRHVWALGKIAAQAEQREPFMHIDLDFFWLNPPPKRVREAAVVVQSLDEPEGYFAKPRADLVKALALKEGVAAWNCGVIGWRDNHLCGQYCDLALDAGRRAARLCRDGFTCSLIAEQYLLGVFLRKHDISPERLIPMASMADKRFGDDGAVPHHYRDVQFVHAWAGSKRNPEVLAKIEARFLADMPDEYESALRGFGELLKLGLAFP